MADLSEVLGIQSWCFRGLPSHEAVVAALRECGVTAIELSEAHLRPWEEPDPAAVVRFYRENGIKISSFLAFDIHGDQGKARSVFEFAAIAGFRDVGIMWSLDDIETASRLCAEFDMRAAVHNHGRYDPLGSIWALDALFGRFGPEIGLCLDTAWMLDMLQDPVWVAKRYEQRLYALHLKDFIFDRAGRPEDVVVGEGNLDLAAIAAYLCDISFSGVFTLEYEGDVSDPVPATRRCVEAVRAALAAV